MANYMQGRNAAALKNPNDQTPPLKREGPGAPTNVRQNEAERRQRARQELMQRMAAKRPQ